MSAAKKKSAKKKRPKKKRAAKATRAVFGRPTILEKPTRRMIGFEARQWNKLNRMSKREGWSISQIVRDLVDAADG